MDISVTRFTVPVEDFDLVGDLHLPVGADAASPVPGIVMSHGFSATRQMGLPAFAEAFAAAGFAVALYDHRCLGQSGGAPRFDIDPWLQTIDMRCVLGWLAGRPEIDADRLALWGSSFSGGESIVLGAVDPRVRAVIANAPFAGTGGELDPATADERFEQIAAIITGAAPPPEGMQIGPMAVVRPEGSEQAAFLDQPESAEWFLGVGPGTGWENTFTVHFSAEPSFDPMVCASRIAPRALLMNVASEDRVAPTATALEAFERAGDPKQLSMFEGHHFSDYDGAIRDRSIETMIAFLRQHLT